jgi:predicted nucleic acid-binding protein
MIHDDTFTALLDANALYGELTRDLLLRFAEQKCFRPVWTVIINQEWSRNLLKNRPDIDPFKLEKVIGKMNEAFPDAEITEFEDLIKGLQLPDPDDRHVLAAAIKGRADVIVTDNVSDFPQEYLKTFQIEIQTIDSFIANLIDSNFQHAIRVLRILVENRHRPKRTAVELVELVGSRGLSETELAFRGILMK